MSNAEEVTTPLLSVNVPETPKTFGQKLKDAKLSTWIKVSVITILVILFIVGIAIFRKQVQHYFLDVLQFIKDLGIWGAFIFIGLYIIVTIALLPASILTLGGGSIFRPLYWGTLIVWIGASIGAMGSFLLGKTLLRSWVAEKVKNYPRFKAIDGAVKQQGWKIVLLLRLSPIIPFSILNYSLALTDITLLQYFLPTCFGMLPGTLLYVYLGSLAGDLAEVATGKAGPNWAIQITIWVVSGVVIIVAVVFVSIISKRAIDKALKEQEVHLHESVTNLK